jgi:hypothetical protein
VNYCWPVLDDFGRPGTELIQGIFNKPGDHLCARRRYWKFFTQLIDARDPIWRQLDR